MPAFAVIVAFPAFFAVTTPFAFTVATFVFEEVNVTFLYVAFEGARVALPVFIDEYSKECERKNIIENKINTLLTIEIATLTVQKRKINE